MKEKDEAGSKGKLFRGTFPFSISVSGAHHPLFPFFPPRQLSSPIRCLRLGRFCLVPPYYHLIWKCRRIYRSGCSLEPEEAPTPPLLLPWFSPLSLTGRRERRWSRALSEAPRDRISGSRQGSGAERVIISPDPFGTRDPSPISPPPSQSPQRVSPGQIAPVFRVPLPTLLHCFGVSLGSSSVLAAEQVFLFCFVFF